MTDELDPQTQQHIDDSADVTADTDAVTCDSTDVDGPILDESSPDEIRCTCLLYTSPSPRDA